MVISVRYSVMLVGFSMILMGFMTASEANDDGGVRPFGEAFASRTAVYGQNGAVATSHPLASLTALEILKKGGSAIDAAIAANGILSLTEPHMCGPGGDMFAIVWDPNKQRLFGLNASGRSAKGFQFSDLKRAIGNQRLIPDHGALSVTVPGAVQGWLDLHGRYGVLSLPDIFAPAIHYADRGVVVSDITAALWQLGVEELYATNDFYSQKEIEKQLKNFRKVFLPEGRAPQRGELFRNSGLAKTLKLIARHGRKGFYEGEAAENIVSYLNAMGSPLSLQDFAEHQSEWVDPVFANYRGYNVYELPPNGQGLSVLQMLNILEGFDLAALGRNNADFWHLLIETKKLVYEDRAKFYADKNFASVPINGLLSKNYAAQRRQLIDMKRAMASVAPGSLPIEKGNTTYITVADANGYMVSMIQSVYGLMGSGLVAEDTGFVLQNRGAQFSVEGDHRNRYQPNKRPFHTIIPAFVTKDGEPILSFGVVGGAMQPQAQVQVLLNLIDFGMNVQSAGDAARIRHIGSTSPKGGGQKSGGELYVETGISRELVTRLEKKGHKIKVYSQQASDYVGGYQGIMKDTVTGIYQAGSEMRLDGMALAY